VADDLAYWRAEIPGKVMAAAEALNGPMCLQRRRVQLLNPPGSEVGLGEIATWIKITTNRVSAYGFRSDCAGKSSTFRLIGRVQPEAGLGSPRSSALTAHQTLRRMTQSDVNPSPNLKFPDHQGKYREISQ
jgi:hypothetical protein